MKLTVPWNDHLASDRPPVAPLDHSECAFPACDCPGENPVCPDYETTNETRRLGRIAGGKPCPVHLVDEPCPTCTAYIAGSAS